MTLDLVVVGVISIDTTVEVPFIPARDSECFAETIIDAHGGAAANVAAFASFYGGLRVGLISRTGDDNVGHDLVQRMLEYRVDVQGIRTTFGKSSTRIVTLLLPDGGSAFLVHLGAHSLLSTSDIPPDYLSEPRAVYIAPCSPAIHSLFVQHFSSRTKLLCINPGSVYMEQASTNALLPLLSHVHTLFLNEAEALAYSGKTNLGEAASALLSFGPEQVVITVGTQGTLIYSEHASPIKVSQARQVRYVSSIGAGDAFAAGYLSEFLRSGDVRAAAKSGNIFGAYAVTQRELRHSSPEPNAIRQVESQT